MKALVNKWMNSDKAVQVRQSETLYGGKENDV